MKKKSISILEIIKKVRRTWTRDPSEKIIPNKKKYDRKRDKNIDNSDY